MSGPTALQQSSGGQQESVTTPAEDPAASLRAAALKTLKSKRRKGPDGPDPPSGLPSRPLASGTPSIQLDYGSEDPYARPSSVPATTPTASLPTTSRQPPPPPPPPPAPVHMDVDEDQTREEGEISDSESMPPPKSPQVHKQAPPPISTASVKYPAKDRPMPPPVVPPSPSVSTVSVKTESTSHMLYDAPASSIQSSPSLTRYSPVADYDIYTIDEEHVRPGLAMTQAQYDTAKDIVLDLLGWGVPPEYLVNCGLSREIIYFVFIELNLRLPTNLDTTGLPPPPWYSHAYASPEPMSPTAPSRDLQRPRSAPHRRSVGEPHPSLPKKPTAPQGTPPGGDSTPLSATAAPFVPSASLSAVPMQSEDSPTSPSLIDMEQQRRQELLARKAVLASRKKQAATSSSSSSAALAKDANDAAATSTVAPTAVDDFLKTIDPVGGSASGNMGSTSPTTDDPMDVDEPIPGLSAGDVPSTSQFLDASAQRSTSPDSMPGLARNIPPPSESEGSTRSVSIERNGLASDASSSSGTPQPQSFSARRGTKRPVAADFVDMDARPPSYNHHHHSSHPAHPHLRRKTHSFAGITHARRIVIDLSDSEEEVEEAVGHRLPASQQPSRPPTRLGASPSLHATGTTSLPGEPATPAALAEKEQEIKRMRELIAERERARLNKLAANSNRSTPVGSASGTPVPQTPVAVQRDENLSAPAPSTTDARVESDPGTSNFSSASSTSTLIDTPTTSTQPAQTDQVLTVEARQEHVARLSSPDDPEPEATTEPVNITAVDLAVSHPEASTAQASLLAPSTSQFSAYQSLLSTYPLLRSRSPPQLPDADSRTESVAPHLSDLSVLSPVSLSTIKAAAVNIWLSDPSRRVCQYEVPGGGECRDPQCEDIHPSQASTVEPSDEETARYLHSALPKASEVTLEQLLAALQDFRRQQLGFEDRVKQALASLGLRMAA